jgi:hypothetical protein
MQSKIDERWPPREQLLADDHGVRNHRRRLIDHELVGQSAAVRIFGVARVCFMQKAVLSKDDLWLRTCARTFGMVKMARKKEGTWTASSTKRCKQIQMRRLLVEIRVIQRKGGFVAVRQGHGRDDSTFSRGKMARKKEWTRPRTRW